MRGCCVVALAIVIGTSPGNAQEQATEASKFALRVRDPLVEALAADARVAPPEFAADVLVRLAGSPKVVDPAWKRELLEEAYLLAYASAEPYRRFAVSIPVDSRQGAQARASESALTRVSLQARVVQLMAFVDRERAREMFEWIDLNLEPGACENPLVPAVDEYYTALAVIARTTFGNDAGGRGEAVRFFNLYMWRAQLPTEMPAVARALRRFRPTYDEAVYLESTFRWILESSLRDPRGFSSVSIDVVNRLMELEDADRNLGVANWNVTHALRAYLIAQLQGPRCADSLSDGPAVETFNGALRRRNIRAEVIAPVAASETRPSRMLGTARINLYWQTLDARRLYTAAGRLRGTGRNPVSLQVRQTAEWRIQAEHLLNDLEQWSGTREATERDYFFQRAALYTVLVDLVPAGALRNRTLRSFVDFLRHSDRDREGRLLWFIFVDRLLELAHTGDRPALLAALEESHHPVLALYGRLQRLQSAERR